MKKNLLIIIPALLLSISAIAQTPEKMSYQAVIRNTSNQLITDQLVGMQISILQGTSDGIAVYVETHNPTSNANGLVSIEIGNGTVLSGNFSTIDWTAGPYFVKTETDIAGGSNYTITGISQLLSVPYSLHSKTAESITGALNETDPVFSAWDKNYNDLTNTPEIPTVPENVSEFNNDAGYLSSFTETDPEFTSWDKDYNDLINTPAIPTVPENVSEFNNDAGYLTSYTETDPEFTSWDKDYNDLINTPVIPTVPENVSEFNNDAGYLTSYTETDPVYGTSAAAGITSGDVTNWNNKTYISDSDGDTKIETEQTPDEDAIHIDVAGTETISMNNSTGTVMKLPTNDENSSLKVKNSDGDMVFGVDGRGLMNGDGSGLSNVKPLIAYQGGNSSLVITSNDPYNPTLVKYVEITVPGPGVILTQATGYIRWKSTNADYCRMSIISNNVATGSASFGSDYFNYLMLSGDHNLTDSIDEYNNFSYSRVFTVSAAGTYRYNLWADKAYSSCYIEIDDVNMQLLYFPTGGTGDLDIQGAKNMQEETYYDPAIPRNLDGTVKAISSTENEKLRNDKEISPGNK